MRPSELQRLRGGTVLKTYTGFESKNGLPYDVVFVELNSKNGIPYCTTVYFYGIYEFKVGDKVIMTKNGRWTKIQSVETENGPVYFSV